MCPTSFHWVNTVIIECMQYYVIKVIGPLQIKLACPPYRQKERGLKKCAHLMTFSILMVNILY